MHMIWVIHMKYVSVGEEAQKYPRFFLVVSIDQPAD